MACSSVSGPSREQLWRRVCPHYYFRLGVADPGKFKEAETSGVPLPSNHSPYFAPDMEPSLKTAMESEVVVLRNLMATGSASAESH
jgi:hypothetical protein